MLVAGVLKVPQVYLGTFFSSRRWSGAEQTSQSSGHRPKAAGAQGTFWTMLSGRKWDCWGCPVQSQELDLILDDHFHLGIFYDSSLSC